MSLEGGGRSSSSSASICTGDSSSIGMNSVSCGNGKLRQWLIEQIDSNKYPGLVWENEEKSIFRIPWKHAGKQDYNREEDAALFKVGAWRHALQSGMCPGPPGEPAGDEGGRSPRAFWPKAAKGSVLLTPL